jgi:16S rRNA (guanine(966)-N(2))-methyltransferase RsmD
MDRVKESLFNIIRRDILDATFLDLFAGTGSVGIEALSRGARQAVFIDLEQKAVQTIQANLNLTNMTDRAIVQRGNALSILKKPPIQQFDFIYVAPPQYKGLWLDVLKALDSNAEWVTPDTTVILQIDPSEQTPVVLEHLEATDQRRYGNTLLWFFNAREGQSSSAPQEKSL